MEEIQKIVRVSIKSINKNPNNPRLIKDSQFYKLVKSIQHFPEMLEIRPIVVDENMMVLGGNMRLRACKEAGLKEVPIIQRTDLSEDQKLEFIVKDNVSFGSWDAEMLNEMIQLEKLLEYGVEVSELSINDIQKEQKALEDDMNPVYPIAPRMSEKHDYVMILAEDEIEFAFLRTFFNMESQKDYKASRVGQGRVITFKDFKKIIDERDS